MVAALSAAARLGTAYGGELHRRDVTLGDALRACIFFRNATIEAVLPGLLKRGTAPDGVSFADAAELITFDVHFARVPGLAWTTPG